MPKIEDIDDDEKDSLILENKNENAVDQQMKE